MKKMYFLLTFALLCCVNVAFAAVELGEPKTTFADGDKVLITTTYTASGVLENGNTRFISNSWNKPAVKEIEAPTVSEVYQMVAVGEKFALKNVRGGFYLSLPASLNTDDHLSTSDNVWSVGFETTTDLSKATAFDVMLASAAGEILKYDPEKAEGREPAEDDISFLVTMTDDFGEEVTLALNNVGGVYMATYNDYATWYTVAEAVEVEDWEADLGNLLNEVMGEAFVNGDMDGLRKFIGGTTPGCLPADVVDALYEKFFAADVYYNEEMGSDPEELKSFCVALEAAWQAIMSSEVQPMTAGKYRILNGTAGFLTRGYKAAMYAAAGGGAWNKLDSLNISYVWEVSQHGEDADGSKTWKIQNVSTKQYFTTVEWNSRVTFTEEFVKPHYIEPLKAGAQFNIIQTNGNANKLHAAGHSNGNGSSGNIVIWDGGSYSASSWTFEAVTDAEIEAALEATKQAELNDSLAAWISKSAEKLAIAKKYLANRETPLLTDAAQISSNADHNSLNASPDGGGIPALIDGDGQTYFHSDWSGTVTEPHYLQFALNEPVSVVSFDLTRRLSQAWNNNNFPNTVDILVSTDGAEFKKVTSIAGITKTEAKDSIPSTTVTADLAGSYSHIRMVVTKTAPNAKIFFTLGELQMYPSVLDPNCLYQTVASAPALDAALTAAMLIENATQADIDALKTAYDTYIAELPDPTALNAAIEKATALLETMQMGTSPGMFPEGTDVSALETEVANAQALLETEPSKAQIEAQVVVLNAAIDALLPLRNGIKTDVWYYITNASNTDHKDWGMRATVDAEHPAGSNVTEINLVQEYQGDDLAKWRFIALGDTAFIMQNKATGLYMNPNSSGVHIKLYHMPGMFKCEYLGATSFLLDGYRLDNAYINPLHGQNAGHVLVGWPAKELGSNSAWNIISTEEEIVLEDIPANQYTDKMVMGLPIFRTYPFPVDINEQNTISFYSILNTVAPNEDAPNGGIELITLEDEDGILPAGVPFIAMWGTPADFKEERTETDTLEVTWTFAQVSDNQVPTTPVVAEDSLVIGTYYGVNAPKDATVLTYGTYDTYVTSDDPAADRDQDGWVKVEEGSVFGVNAHCLTSAWNPGWNSAYINTDKLKNLPVAEVAGDGDGEVFIPFNRPIDPVLTGIEVVEGKVNAVNGDIYTTTGILVRKNSTSTVGLPKGMYIVNGKTVIVK